MDFRIGNGALVDSLIGITYPNVYYSNLHEIKTSAITYLVLQKMNENNFHKDYILQMMLGNLRYNETMTQNRAIYEFSKYLESKSCQKLSDVVFETILKLKEKV